MADLLTTYDDEESNIYIDCKMCNKKIRGETNYKVHQTTIQHLKKEEALAAKGRIPKPAPLPEWTDIKQYLVYLNLDEPIIGLSHLMEMESVTSDDGKVLLKYKCKICSVEMDMYSMVAHVVGRRHRQKYLECKMLQFETWSINPQIQPSLVARAKAEELEKQEGWGTPIPLKIKSETESRLKYRAGNRPPSLLQLKVTPVRGRKAHYSQAEDSYRTSYLEAKTHGRSYSYRKVNDEPYDDRPNYRDASQEARQKSSHGRDRAKRPYMGKDSDVGPPEDERSGRSYFDEAMPSAYDQHQNEYYTERKSSRERYSSRDEPDSFYQGCSSGSVLADSGAASHHGEINYHAVQDQMGMSRQGRGSSLDEMQLHDRNYQYTDRGGDHFQDVRRTAKTGSFEMEGRRQTYSPNEEVPAKKQRKSRFSDASPMDKALAWKSKFDADKERTDSRRTQQVFGRKGSSGGSQFTPKMENVLDVLNDIQIESVEEANFLKEKLCTLFKEFQSNKAQCSQQTGQALHAAASLTDYGHRSDPRIDQLRDVLQSRRVDDQEFQESARFDHDFRFPDGRHNTKGVLQNSDEYEHDHGDFQEHFEEDQKRRYEDDSREYLNARRLDTESIWPRGSSEARHGDYERNSLDSGHRRETSRRAVEDRYSKGTYESQQECDWDIKRGRTDEQSEEYVAYDQDGERRDYRDDLWNPRSRSEEGMHTETQRAQYLDDYNSGLNLYDPCHPSSPPRRHSSTLDKLASTLLELVARKTN